ncbi:carbohydrate ABC transporter permease [Microbacterium sp. 1.5R]|uniref:carbohydrate ABC transporter permease n=1 Tax=Microbacterium sp. 1.5R TaxID=1916917 RepID=UPI00119D9B8A|nr:sugar ABC transporter permease [Microbacterium sp. 1.5R]
MKSIFVARAYPRTFLLPAIVIFTIFFLFPAILGLWLAFTDASTLSQTQQFIGLANFELLFIDNLPGFAKSVGLQFLYAIIVTVLKTLVGVALAFLLDRVFRGNHALRTIVYLPMMLSTIVVGSTFYYLLANDGPVNQALRGIGLGFLTQDWFGNFDLALYTVGVVETWMGVGWTMVIVLAALQAVPKDLIEAAHLDGVSAWQMARYLKIPFISHAITLTSLLSFVGGMKAFDIIIATTGGGPGTATSVLTIFNLKALSTSNLGYASAVSFTQFVVVTAIALVLNSLIARRTKANDL